MIPVSTVEPGMFFRNQKGDLYYVSRLKSNGKPEICKMLYGENRWFPPQTAYGVNKAEFHSADALVAPLNNDEVLKWNHKRFVRATQTMVKAGDRFALRKLVAKALAPANRRLKEIGAPEQWTTELARSLGGGPESITQTTNRLITEHKKAEETERTVQALLADLDKAIQAEAGDVELELWDLFVNARQRFEFAVCACSGEKRQEVIQNVKGGALGWVRKQVALAKERKG
jgi:hypothetical protein